MHKIYSLFPLPPPSVRPSGLGALCNAFKNTNNWSILSWKGGYSSVICVETCCWDLKSRPILIPKMRPIFQSHKCQANFTENCTLFSKLVKLSRKFQKFGYQIDEIGPIFKEILDYFENYMTYFHTSFCINWIRGYCYTRRLILRPISAAHSQIGLSTRNLPSRI